MSASDEDPDPGRVTCAEAVLVFGAVFVLVYLVGMVLYPLFK